MGTYECKVQIPEVNGLEAGKLTVGRHIILNCNGEPTADFDFAKASFKDPNPYAFKIFNARPTGEGQFEIDFTTYKTQSINLTDSPLTDGSKDLVLSAEPLTVESVMQPSQNGEAPKAFGPIFPIKISIPDLYFIYLGLTLVLLVLYSIFKARNLAYFKKLKSRVAQFDSVIDPETQFYRAIRQAEKKQYPIGDIEAAFVNYNIRAYKLPLFELSPERSIRYFKRNYPKHKQARIHLQKIFNEFEEFKKKQDSLSFEERSEMVKKLYRYVDQHKGLNS